MVDSTGARYLLTGTSFVVHTIKRYSKSVVDREGISSRKKAETVKNARFRRCY